MNTGTLVVLVLLNAILAVVFTGQIQKRFPEYYEEIGSPNYGVSGPGMFMFMFGHILIFRYLPRTRGFLRVALVAWSVVLWGMIVGFVMYFA